MGVLPAKVSGSLCCHFWLWKPFLALTLYPFLDLRYSLKTVWGALSFGCGGWLLVPGGFGLLFVPFCLFVLGCIQQSARLALMALFPAFPSQFFSKKFVFLYQPREIVVGLVDCCFGMAFGCPFWSLSLPFLKIQQSSGLACLQAPPSAFSSGWQFLPTPYLLWWVFSFWKWILHPFPFLLESWHFPARCWDGEIFPATSFGWPVSLSLVLLNLVASILCRFSWFLF